LPEKCLWRATRGFGIGKTFLAKLIYPKRRSKNESKKERVKTVKRKADAY